MNHVADPRAADIRTEHHAEFVMVEHSARYLRRILRLYLVGSGMAEVADAAGPALTELVADVVRYAPDRRCRMCFLLQSVGVRVEATDDCPELPAPAVGGGPGESGRGLAIVDAVTDRWGVAVRPDGRGKTVWFKCLGRRQAVPMEAKAELWDVREQVPNRPCSPNPRVP